MNTWTVFIVAAAYLCCCSIRPHALAERRPSPHTPGLGGSTTNTNTRPPSPPSGHHHQSPWWFSPPSPSPPITSMILMMMSVCCPFYANNGKEEWLCAVINATLFSRNLICKLRNLSPWPWQRWKVVLGLEFTIHRDARDNADSVQLDWIQRSQSVALWWSHRLRNPSRPAMGLQCRLYISPFEAMRAASKYYRLTYMSLRPWTWL